MILGVDDIVDYGEDLVGLICYFFYDVELMGVGVRKIKLDV